MTLEAAKTDFYIQVALPSQESLLCLSLLLLLWFPGSLETMLILNC